MSRVLYIIFAWIGRATYNTRERMENLQNWADRRADRYNRDTL